MKATFFALIALAAAAASACAEVDLGSPASRTPYDGYMGPVKHVLSSLKGNSPSMDRVQALMREGLSFRYSYTEPYVAATPEMTAATKKGDCKAKALWLANEMGDNNVRFVVGKAHRNSKLSHAWLTWQHDGQWWILDPTNTSRPIPADRVSHNDYIPLFSWSKGRTFQHTETGAYLSGIAHKQHSPVAGPASYSLTSTASAFFHR
jgi:hypothetical protein